MFVVVAVGRMSDQIRRSQVGVTVDGVGLTVIAMSLL